MGHPVTIDGAVLDRYERFSLYNSPYRAHDLGHAIDLYPDESTIARSPVAGTVLETRTVGCPDRPYAVDEDHLIAIEVTDGVRAGGQRDSSEEAIVARILHVDPAVESGDRVAIGDPLGELVRSGFFGQWVDNHLHLEFRSAEANYLRASGALPLSIDVPVEPIAWDGTGRVVDTGPTHALLDAPAHPNPGTFAAIACDDGFPLDGGMVHYGGGGVLSSTRAGRHGPEADENSGEAEDAQPEPQGTQAGSGRFHTLFGTPIGRSRDRHLRWHPIDVLANGKRITGLSLFASQVEWGAKLVTIDRSFAVGDRVALSIEPSDDPIVLGGRDRSR